MKGNVITANFRNGQFVHTDPLWQYDYGQVLRFTGVSLPETFEVHFSNAKEFGQAKTAIGTADGVLIPDEYLVTGKPVFAWIFLHTGADDGETVYMAQIPVNKRSVPSDEAPTPQEQSAITQAIAALNSAVVDVQEAVEAADSARASASSAGASATAAAASKAGVAEDADRASAAATAAEAAQAGAETAQTGAESARDEAAQASAAQIAQINATGAAVLESIPADYTKLSDSVSNLKSDIYDVDRQITSINGLVLTNFEQGSVNTNAGTISNNTKYIRSNLAPIMGGITYTVYLSNETGVTIGPAVIYYDSAKAFLSSKTDLGNKGTGTSVFTVTPPANARYLRFRYNRADGSDIDPSDVTQTLVDENAQLFNSLINKGNISTASLDLNSGDFIHPGMWTLSDMAYAPDHWPSEYIGRLVCLSSSSESSYGTAQIVVDNFGSLFVRYSHTNGSWRDWHRYLDMPYYNDLKAKTPYSYGNIITTGLDLDNGDFIHPGMWSVNDPQYLPYHSPTHLRCRIITFASESNNSIYTLQIVIDASGKVFKRFSTNTNIWTAWKSETALHDNITFRCLFTNNESFINSETIVYDTSNANRVQTLMAKWDAVTLSNGVSLVKQVLGQDASNTYNIYNYKVSNGVTGKPVVLVVFGEHGNEFNSAEIGSYFFKQVVNGCLTKYLKYVDFWLIPLMNPWGYENKQRNNANDVNLNRDFPCEWNYYVVQHNKTGNYSLSQPETQYLYNLLVNNRHKILFMVNKHNTGSISNKININEEDIVGYTATVLKTDTIFNEGLTMWQDSQARETDPWIDTDCNVDISSLPVIVNRSGLVTDGSMDLFANSIGIHGSLLEVCGAANYSTDSPAHYSGAHYQDLARLELDFIVNYVAKAIENNDLLLSKDDLQMRLAYRTRVQDGSVVPLNLTWEQGSINTNTGAESTSTQRCRSDYGAISDDRNIDFTFINDSDETMGFNAIYYDSNHVFLSSDTSLGSVQGGETVVLSITPPSNASYIRFRVQFGSLATITPSDFSGSAEISAWRNVEQYWNGNTLVTITA